MVRYQKDLKTVRMENLVGGKGYADCQILFGSGDTGGHTDMFGVISLAPGSTVGEHLHDKNGELYYILEGEAILIEDGVSCKLSAGDSTYCQQGHRHSLENVSDKPVKFLAVEIQ